MKDKLIISPAYFSNKDLIKEYNELKTDVGKNSYKNNEWEYYYRLSTMAVELKLRNLISLDDFCLQNIFELEKKSKEGNQFSEEFIASSLKQFEELEECYKTETDARLKVPKNIQTLWMQHKYSVMARSVSLYKEIGSFISKNNKAEHFPKVYSILTNELMKRPKPNSIFNVLQHMWGYISDFSSVKKSEVSKLDLHSFFIEIQKSTLKVNEKYLMQQTALSELEVWILMSDKNKDNDVDILKESC